MQPKYEYRRRLPHYQKDDHPLFVTFTTDRRWQLPPQARDIVLACCVRENGSKFDLHATVVMPDHVHLIYSPLRREDGWNYTLPEIMKAIKGRSARDQCHTQAQRPCLAGGVLRSRASLERQLGGPGGVCLRESRAGWAGTCGGGLSLDLERESSRPMRSWSGTPAAVQAARPGLRPGPTHTRGCQTLPDTSLRSPDFTFLSQYHHCGPVLG